MTAPTRMRHWKRWLGVGVAAAAIAVVGGPFLYIHFVAGSAPAPLVLSTPSATSPASGPTSPNPSNVATDGAWNIATGSIVGYRVNEVLFGQSHVAVGRTGSVTGSMIVSGTTVTQATFTVDMTTVTSDQGRRDAQFNGRIMETSTYPTASFTLTKPIALGSIPANGVQRTLKATGTLTLHGVTKSVTFSVTGRYTGSVVQIAGSIPIAFADWGIPNPSFGGVVTTEDHGILEFALSFSHA